MNQQPVMYTCKTCDYSTPHKGNLHKHFLSNKHISSVNNQAKNKKAYDCHTCDFHTVYKNDFTRHMSSEKHRRTLEMLEQKLQPNQCSNCRKMYGSKSALCKHKWVCKNGNNANENESSDDEDDYVNEKQPPPTGFAITPELLLEVLKQNKELQTLLIEQHKNPSNVNTNNIGNINNSHNNTTNKTFNIQFFLNEHCKNAIDIQQFVRTLDYSSENLEKNMKLGYTGGITKMITDGIQILPVEERPLHCTDEKREKIYIRDNGEWISGNESKAKLQSVIADIANNNYNTFRKWVLENPSCQILDTPAYKKYITIFQGVLGARTDEEEIKHTKKILSNIIDEITIEKDKYLI